jgi:hypothetical protein
VIRKPDDPFIRWTGVKNLNISPDNETIYSNDYAKGRHTSILIMYNRAEHLKKMNKTAYKLIDSYPYKTRIEFKLCLNNLGAVMLPDIPSGTHETLISDLTGFLAIVYKKYFLGNIIVDSPEHIHLSKIIKSANNTLYYTYRGTKYQTKEYIIDSKMEIRSFDKRVIAYNNFDRLIFELEWHIEHKRIASWDTSRASDRWRIMIDYYGGARYRFYNESPDGKELITDTPDDLMDELLC